MEQITLQILLEYLRPDAMIEVVISNDVYSATVFSQAEAFNADSGRFSALQPLPVTSVGLNDGYLTITVSGSERLRLEAAMFGEE